MTVTDWRLLTINAGSSSIKAALFSLPAAGPDVGPASPSLRWSGLAEGLGTASTARLRVRDRHAALLHDAALGTARPTSHRDALAALLDWNEHHAEAGRIVAVGHRIVHGGIHFTRPVRIDAEVLDRLTALEPLAPLHQPHNLAGVRAAMQAFPGVPQVACFDTAFHAAQPEVNHRFALPRALHDSGVRRYGFHGLSYESIVARLGQLDSRLADGRVVIAHLGNGASMCAVRAGRSVATTMSFSPLDGLTMGTRCGRLDPAVVLYLLASRGMTVDQVTTLLFRESGLLGLSGVSGDMRELDASVLPAAADAVDHFAEQVVQQLGGMAAALRGIDALVFTGGIGENAAALRRRILNESAWLGFRSDAAADVPAGPRLTSVDSPVSAWVLASDEEAVIAGHTARMLGLGQPRTH